jgi:DNA-directed RNA polymerase specialized sigma24 family protein
MEADEILLTICVGDDAEAEEAFTWLYRNCWEEVLGVLKARETIRSLDSGERETAVSTTFGDLWQQARTGNIKDTDKDPLALLHTIAFRRGIDLVRRKTAKKRHMTPDEWDAFVAEAVEESSFSSQWMLLRNKGLASEIMSDFRAWMKEQKGVCRRTALAMAEFLPDLASPKELQEKLSEDMNPPPTRESVKKARADVLAKFRAAIEAKYEGMWK